MRKPCGKDSCIRLTAAARRESTRTRYVEIGERQRFRPRISFQFRRRSFNTLAIASFEVCFDCIAREQQMVVADGACSKQRFGLIQGRLACGLVIACQRQHAECERAEKRDACLAAYLYGFFCVGKRFRSPPRQAMQFRAKCERFGLEAPRAKLLRQR